MEKNKDKKIELASGDRQQYDKKQPELRLLPEEEIKQILVEHEKWLESDKAKGNKADLSYANLKGKDLSKANLEQAKFRGADLQKANFDRAKLKEAVFREANLQGAYLWGADLQNAYLRKANIRDAVLNRANCKKALFDGIKGLADSELQYADLEDATGLLGNEFAQADLTGTKLPDNIKNFEALKIAEETSKNARNIFFTMLIGCVYSWLTIANTTDVRLLTNSSSSPLPIIGTEIPIAWFYWAAPFVILGLYFYFHYYLDSLWESLAGLPAIFPDGKRLDERAYPWLLNKLVRRHFRLIRKNRPFIARQKEWIIIFLAWWAVPMTLIGFWLRYLPRHEWIGTSIHIGLFAIAVASAIIFYRTCAQVLRGEERNPVIWINIWQEKRFSYVLIPIASGMIAFVLSYGAINGVKPPSPYENREISFLRITEIVPWVFEKLHYSPFANFREKDVSEKPSNYGEIKLDERSDFVNGANLRKRDLRYGDMLESFLVKADLREAKIQGATLAFANLEKAKLEGADLKEANVEGAILLSAKLEKANLQNAIFMAAILKKADFMGANLQGTNFLLANLQEVNFLEAVLKGANLSEADLTSCTGLTQEQLNSACGNEGTKLPDGLTIKECIKKE